MYKLFSAETMLLEPLLHLFPQLNEISSSLRIYKKKKIRTRLKKIHSYSSMRCIYFWYITESESRDISVCRNYDGAILIVLNFTMTGTLSEDSSKSFLGGGWVNTFQEVYFCGIWDDHFISFFWRVAFISYKAMVIRVITSSFTRNSSDKLLVFFIFTRNFSDSSKLIAVISYANVVKIKKTNKLLYETETWLERQKRIIG